MAKWWQRLREWMAPERSAREGRSTGRGAGKSSGKTGGKSPGIGEAPKVDRSLTWSVGMGLVLLALHLKPRLIQK